jgi:hypothetical protein
VSLGLLVMSADGFCFSLVPPCALSCSREASLCRISFVQVHLVSPFYSMHLNKIIVELILHARDGGAQEPVLKVIQHRGSNVRQRESAALIP